MLATVTVIAVGTIAVALGVPAGAVDADHVIIPGVGIGRVRIGMTISQVLAVWGPAQASAPDFKYVPNDGMVSYSWQDGSFPHGSQPMRLVTVDSAGIVTSVAVADDSDYMTLDGLHTRRTGLIPGSSPQDVRGVLGTPDPGGPSFAWRYRSRGLVLIFVANEDTGTWELAMIHVSVPRR
jgi:hypothetical protein